MKKTLFASALVLGTFVTTGVFAANTTTTTNTQTNSTIQQQKFYGNGSGKKLGMGRFGSGEMISQETFQKAQTALKNKDYTTWSQVMNGKGIAQIVNTESKFNKLVQIDTLQEQIKTLREEIGLTGGMMGMGKGMGGHPGRGMGGNPMINDENHEAIQTAIENKDYTTRSKLMDGKGIAEIVNTESKFLKLVQMHTAIQNGDTTTADKLATELGLPAKGQGNRGNQ